MERCEVLVAQYGAKVVGFIHFHTRRDGWHTVYEIAVHKDYQRSKIGSALLGSIPYPRQLVCTVDNSANGFYEKQGMQMVGTKDGRKRMLNMWQIGA